MKLSRAEVTALRTWTADAVPLAGTYFRSVEFRFMDPDEVLSGTGAARIGGRFAPVGTKAVYLSETDTGTGLEVAAHKDRLGGSALITTEKYPRIVFGVTVRLRRVLDISAESIPAAIAALRTRCLDPADLAPSMDVAEVLLNSRVQGLVFPSTAGGDKNLVVYLAHCDAGDLRVQNAPALVAKATRMAAKRRR